VEEREEERKEKWVVRASLVGMAKRLTI